MKAALYTFILLTSTFPLFGKSFADSGYTTCSKDNATISLHLLVSNKQQGELISETFYYAETNKRDDFYTLPPVSINYSRTKSHIPQKYEAYENKEVHIDERSIPTYLHIKYEKREEGSRRAFRRTARIIIDWNKDQKLKTNNLIVTLTWKKVISNKAELTTPAAARPTS